MSDQPEIAKEFDLFLSHSGTDKEWVKTLAERLEQEGIDDSPDARRIKVFLDEWDIDYSQNIVNRLNEGLKKSCYLAAILSPEFLDSGWANQEWTHWFMDDPRARNLLPLLYRSVSLDGKRRIELPMPFKTSKHFDFRENKHFESEFGKLLRRVRGQLPLRGSPGTARYSGGANAHATQSSNLEFGWEADRLDEMIFGNLLKVKSYPEMIWSGATIHQKPPEVWTQIPEAGPFILRDKRLWTVEDLSEEKALLRPVVDSTTISVTKTSDWLADADKSRWLIALFNQIMRNRLGKLGIKKDGKGRFYFKANSDATPRKFTNIGDRERAVAAKKVSADGKSAFFVHFAAFIKFERLGNKLFLMIEPGYVFTENGENPLTPKATGKLAIQWGGQQRNDTIFRNLLFWIKLIANSSKEYSIPTGGSPVVISGVPVAARMTRGLESDQIKIGALLNIGAETDEEDDLEEAARNAEIVQDEEEPDEAEESI